MTTFKKLMEDTCVSFAPKLSSFLIISDNNQFFGAKHWSKMSTERHDLITVKNVEFLNFCSKNLIDNMSHG